MQNPSVPDDLILYAVGDIHGRLDLLDRLLAKIAVDACEHDNSAQKRLIFLGDYVDRGPDSSGVVETLINGLPQDFEAQFLKGNHEALLLDFLKDASCLRQWLVNGAKATLQSYGVDVASLEQSGAPPEAWQRAFAAALPSIHRRFFEALTLMVVVGDYLFVHAGLRPGIPIDAQEEGDLIWIRRDFLESEASFGKFVVHGHTPVMLPERRANRIGIDTGAAFTGRLTALKIEGNDRSFLHT